MPVNATRTEASFARLGFAALGGLVPGACEAVRILLGSRLLWSDAGAGLLIVLGTVLGMLVGLVAAVPLLALPPRPLGRERWGAWLWGALAWIALSGAVTWFTDPPPFTDPFPGQGNVLAFGGVLVFLGLIGLVLYQGVRGAKAVGSAATVLSALAGAWAWSGADPAPAPKEAAPKGAPNVLVVTLDTTRADHIGAYGNADMATANFDKVAAEGALFLNASAVAAVTGPSHTSMFTGSGPWDHQVLLNGIPLPDDRPLISEVLRAHGWATAAFVSAYVLDGDLGFRRGFTVYDDDFGWLKGTSDLMPARLLAMAQRHGDPDEVLERRGGDTTDEALAWLAARSDETPFYLWVHLFDAHGPYTPPPPWDTHYYQGDPKDPAHTSMSQVKDVASYLKKSLLGITDLDYVLAQYEGEISYADAQVGRLLAAVDGTNTIVIVIGDHGESLGEHGVWFNHGDDVYETSVHVPFAARWPGHIPAGTRITNPVEGTDLAPTVLGLVGIEPPPTMTGSRAVTDDGTPGSRSVAKSMCYDREANQTERAAGRITKPKYRMAAARMPSARCVQRELSGSRELFDLAADPSGLKDVRSVVELTQDGGNLLAGCDQIIKDLFAASTDRSAAELSDEERERLKALGYLEP